MPCADAAGKPVTAVLLATADGPITPGSKVPNFMFPEPAAAVLGRSWAYGRWLATEAASPPAVVADVDSERAGELIARALLDGIDHLDPATTADLLAAYGIPVPPTRYVAIGEARRSGRSRSASPWQSRLATATSDDPCAPGWPSISSMRQPSPRRST